MTIEEAKQNCKPGWQLNKLNLATNIIKAINRNNGYCPCMNTSEDKHCPCSNYKLHDYCCCNLYIKE